MSTLTQTTNSKASDTNIDHEQPLFPKGAFDREIVYPLPTSELIKIGGPAVRGSGESIPDLSHIPEHLEEHPTLIDLQHR